MIRQEGESSPSVVSNGSTLIADPLLVEPRAGTIPSGVFPKCELPHVTQHCGAEGWVFNRDRPFDVPFRKTHTAQNFSRTAGATHDFRSLSVIRIPVTQANHQTLRQPVITCIRQPEQHRSVQPELHSWLQPEQHRSVRCHCHSRCCSRCHSRCRSCSCTASADAASADGSSAA